MAAHHQCQKGFPEEVTPGLRLSGKQELRRKKEGGGLAGENGQPAGAKIRRWAIVWCVQAEPEEGGRCTSCSRPLEDEQVDQAQGCREQGGPPAEGGERTEKGQTGLRCSMTVVKGRQPT